ncbi:hypothetical protein FQN50_003731 [Emmonsiellopsis sp. PD_5]|nr:hypothetical protein FQN50_003731 [Emmonsiellopsis sp. PD_5]
MSSNERDELHFIPLHSRSDSNSEPSHNSRNPYQPVPSSSDPLDDGLSPRLNYDNQTDTPDLGRTVPFGLGISGRHSRMSSNLSSPEIHRTGSPPTSAAFEPSRQITPAHKFSSSTTTPTLDGHFGTASPGKYDPLNCPSAGNIRHKRMSWLSVTILTLAFYSTALSGLYMIVAFVKPRYGRRIGHDGGIAPDTASLLSALFAKTVELSFVTVFVAFLGQVLSRRAITSKATGISIADMSMRGWIMQPGTLITHWEHVKYAGLSFLGMIALTATIMALLYTTAADALVSPKLKFGPEEMVDFSGRAMTAFANIDYLKQKCLTPIPIEMDKEYRNSTCLQLSHVGQSYHNYREYMSDWGRIANAGHKNSTDPKLRIPPGGTWNDNTTIQGSWIHVQDTAEASRKHGRTINNVTVAMPHAGLLNASRDEINSLRQPNDFAGLGEFFLRASVVSPVVNVLCVGMTKEELLPIVYNEWPNTTLNVSRWNEKNTSIPAWPGSKGNKTVVDDLFQFGKPGLYPPIFPTFPKEYQTVVNGSKNYLATELHILVTNPNVSQTAPYNLCAVKAGLTTQCSTLLHATASGSRLEVHCDEPNDTLRYNYGKEKDVEQIIWQESWENFALEWANSLSLGAGISDGAASNARLLSQYMLHFDRETNTSTLSPTLPSTAEALAVMASSTLMMASEDATFHIDPPTEETLGKYEKFKASLRVSDYASGGVQTWQRIFYVVLVLVFLTNLFCLVYLFFDIKGVQVTDFTEPQNMFALAMNSSGSTRLNGACGAGPAGKQLSERWVISMEEESEHYYITSKAEKRALIRQEMERREDMQLKPDASPAVKEYRRISQNRNSISLFS